MKLNKELNEAIDHVSDAIKNLEKAFIEDGKKVNMDNPESWASYGLTCVMTSMAGDLASESITHLDSVYSRFYNEANPS